MYCTLPGQWDYSLSWAFLFAFQLLRSWLWVGFFSACCCLSEPNMVSVPTRAGSYFVSSLHFFCAQSASPSLSCIGLEIAFSSDLCTQLVYLNNWK